MKLLFQVVSVCAIALGVGLLVGGISVDPANRARDLGELAQTLGRSDRELGMYRDLSATLKGVGAAFLTLGALGLLVPWVNVLVYGREPRDPSTSA